jgi:hypothetical protein
MWAMIRTQISFDEEQFEDLQRDAREAGMSMAAYVREAVDQKLAGRRGERGRLNRLALSAIGRLRGAPGERLGADHDRYLEEAFGDS